MLSVPFYHSLLKKYVIIFGTLFNNIRIERLNSDGTVAQTIKVPINYGPRDKYLARVEANPTGTASVATILPRIAFEMTGIRYASDRKLQTTIPYYSNQNINNDNVLRKVYSPVPYDIDFTLYIMVKTTEDGTRIVEQILPYFTPEWTISARLLDDFERLTDIPIVINTVDIDDTYQGSFEERRALIYTLNFTMKGYLFGPTTQSKIIKIATIQTYAPLEANSSLTTIETYPGMDANGNPTTNSAITIPYSEIGELDNWDYIVELMDNTRGQ